MNSIRPRPQIERLATVPHGGFNSTRPPNLLDFSSNVNPFGPSPRVWDALRGVAIGQHPDPRATPLRKVLAQAHSLDAREVLVGNGSVELIYHLAVAFLRASDRVLIVGPTFGEYAAAAGIMGSEVVMYRASAERNFEVELEALLSLARETQPRLIFLCNPNNPIGAYLPRDAVEALLRGCPGSLLVLDEAFVRFAAGAWDSRGLLAYGNLLILRSMTKDYALTGLRVGYAIGAPGVIEALEKVQPPWSVNAFAQAAAIAALRDEDYLRETLAEIAHASTALRAAFAQGGWRVMPSAVHFSLVEVGDARSFCAALVRRGLAVRDCSSFGLPAFVRVATRKPEENAQLASALAALRREGS
ncbi:MAG: histidinol-phosphate aminotransferase family protein [Chloroflexi bacterium]|nr:histidinol-phosphate aminotransferase family protein [Chloroflexota bacterium]